MKKILLSAVMLAAVYTLCAQEVVAYKTTTTTYVVPVTVKTNFETAYPVATQVTWQPVNDYWWYATYKDENNRLVSVYYNTQPYYLIRNESYKMSLPVLNTMVPEAVITDAINRFGSDLYSITALKPENGQDKYQVTVIKNGVAETMMLDGSSMVYTNSNAPVQQ